MLCGDGGWGHHVLLSVVGATVGYYRRDQYLDAAGVPINDGNQGVHESFVEYSLPELGGFADSEMTGTSTTTLQQNILNVLSSIPDYQGTQQSLVEVVTPNASDGTPQESAAYLRVKPNLTQPYLGFTVPGIILNATDCVMRTDQLVCDAVLGQGDALDSYSHGLQDVAIADRQAAVSARNAATAREVLAQQIVSQKQTDLATIWSRSSRNPCPFRRLSKWLRTVSPQHHRQAPETRKATDARVRVKQSAPARWH